MKQINLYFIILIPIILILLVALILFYLNKVTTNEITNLYQTHIKKDYIMDNETILIEKVKGFEKIINYENKKIENDLKKDLKDKVNMAINIANETYFKYSDKLSPSELKQLIIDNISSLKFYEDRGYFYILDANSEVVLGHPTKKFIGKSFANFKDALGQAPIKKQIKMLKNSNENLVYLKLYFYLPNDDKKMYPKLVSSTIYKPFNLFIGTGEYLNVIEQKVKQNVIEEIKALNTTNIGEKICLFEISDITKLDNIKDLLDNNEKFPKEILKNKESIIKQLQENGSALVTYEKFDKSINKHTTIHQYIYYDKKWNWLITSHFSEKNVVSFLSELNSFTNKKFEELKKSHQLTTIIVVTILLLISLFILSRFTKLISNYTNTIEKQNYKLQKNELLLKEEIKKAVEENRKKDIKYYEQSKIADMGRLMKNIAHQWRQPLNLISTTTSSLKLNQMMNTLEPKSLDKSLEDIDKSVIYLSDTIDMFINYVSEDKEKKEIIVQESIEKTLLLIKPSLRHLNIKLVKDLDNDNPINIKLFESEFSKIITNIINNAKDVLESRQIDKPWVRVSLKKDDDYFILTIEDNAQGIKEEQLYTIFQPYHTTKHQFQGIGLSLHICYKIITEDLKGDIAVENTTNGAKFTIKVPLIQS